MSRNFGFSRKNDIDRQREENEYATRPRKSLKEQKEQLYDKIKIPVKTLDMIIYGMVALVFILLIVGMMIGNG